MEFNHTSVLLAESVEGLAVRADGIYVDGTLGGGGHAAAICENLGHDGTLVGIDRDGDAIEASEIKLQDVDCKVITVRDNYSNIKQILTNLHINQVHGAVIDLGVSSFQLDNPARGFSYMQDAPLDMRMNTEDRLTAEEVINEYEKQRLFQIIKSYGEEKWAARIAEFIVKGRQKKRITSTHQLADIIKSAVPRAARQGGPHPAKRTFQAIRIEVNNELSVLEYAVRDFIDVLSPGGRLAVITFHSLEDRIVKNVFHEYANPCTCPKHIPYCVCEKTPMLKKITRKPITASALELSQNPRSRSAKLRIIERI